MNGISYRQFALPEVLKEVGKDLLVQFCAHFQSDLAAQNIPVPDPDLPGDDYFKSLATLLRCPALLPESFKETLFDIEDLASPDRSAFLKETVAELGQGRIIVEGVCHERAALQLWLMAPAGILALQDGQKKLTSFEGFASEIRRTSPPPVSQPSQAGLVETSKRLNAWFRQRNHDAPTANIELYVNRPGEYWFLVRHGDTCRWSHDDEEGTAQLIHSAPETDEAILYVAEEDELWITARTGEDREFYRQEFGLQLRGNPDYFSVPCSFSLEPLRIEGSDALDAGGFPPIRRMVVVQVEVDRGGASHETTLNAAEAVLQPAPDVLVPGCFIANTDTLVRAAFLMQLAGSEKTRAFEICPPYSLDIERPSDLSAILRLLTTRRFRNALAQMPSQHSKAA